MKRMACITTTACNLRCRHCSRQGTETNNVSAAVVEKSLDVAGKLGFRVLSFTGGEPCLHPDFKGLVELALSKGFWIQFVTNGTLISRYKFILEDHRDKLALMAISLDGANRQTHESIRGRGTYEDAVEAIRHSLARKAPVKVLTCLNKLNMHEIEDIYWHVLRLGAGNLSFSGISETAYNKDLVLDHDERQDCARRINKLIRLGKMRVNYNTSLTARSVVDFCTSLDLGSLTINARNQMVPCCDLMGDGVAVGSLEEEDFLTLYQRCLDAMNELKKEKARLLTSNENRVNGCAFCDDFLQKLVMRKTFTEARAEKISHAG